MANKSIYEFSAPTTDNIRTGPTIEIDRTFVLKLGLINMVQGNQFCGKAHEDASAHLQHFLEICSTFTILEVPRDTILLRILTVGESEAVVLHNQGEEYYVGTLVHELSSQVHSHGQDQCSPWEDYKFSAIT